MDQMVGQILDNTYRIDKLLGQGGMGAVFRAHDIALNRDAAIKVMHPHIARQEGFRERFLQEARAIAALEHPNIVPIYTFSRDPERLYIAMAFVQGQNLREWLGLLSQQGMVISLGESLAIIECLCDALAYAHRRGVFHRDIKPGNIILKPMDAGQTNSAGLSFQPVLTDFGLAKLAEGGIHSMAGMAMGTPAYMAPEQCEGLEIDGRADIYALGIVLYELVTGRVPFDVKTLTEAIRAHTKEPPPPPRSLAPGLPTAVEDVILKAMAKRPADRYQTADLMGQACRAARLALPRVESVTMAATQAGQVSLITMMAQQEAPPPAPEKDAWPTPPAEIPVGGRLLVMGPDGSTRAVALGSRQRLTIGRDASNDVAISSGRVSRHHAQITFDGTRYFITDLNSTNGTFIENARLLPGIAEPWQPTQAARVGDYWLRLEVAGGSPAMRPEASAAARMARPAAAPEQLLTVSMEPSRLTARAGSSVDAALRILNRQLQVDHIAPAVDGIPASWVTLPSQMLRLAPGDTGTVTLRFHPPLSPSSAAGEHQLVIRVASQSNPTSTAQIQASLVVEPFHDVRLALSPTVLNNPGRSTLRVVNQGNTPEDIQLTGIDAADALLISPDPPRLTLQGGEQADVALPVRTKAKRPLMGNPQTYAFTVNATTATGPVSAVQGSLEVRPVIPSWAIPLIVTLVMLLCAGAAFAYSNMQKSKMAAIAAETAAAQTQTANGVARANLLATATETARAPLLTATAAAMTGAQAATATAAAASATAAYLAADPDGDGLTNQQELQWGTNPNNRDTDGDTLTDGQEVGMGISPTSKDTDGDGLQDNVDPAPGSLPTPTSQPSATPTATPTLTPSPTGTPAFPNASTRDFALYASAVGTVTEVCLKHDNSGPSPDWYVTEVQVDAGSGFEPFSFNRWIATDKADGDLTACVSRPIPITTMIIVQPIIGKVMPLLPTAAATPTFSGIYKVATTVLVPALRPTLIIGKMLPNYTIKVSTGNVAGAGTAAQVQIRLTGTGGTTDWLDLK